MKNIVKRLGCTLLIACTVVSQVAVPTIVDAYTKSTISTGTYLLKNVYSGKYLNVSGSGNANLTNVNIYTKSGATGQTFDISALAGEYVLSPKCASTRVLNIKGSSVTSGANVNIYSKDYSGDDTQLWAFEKVSNGYVVRSAGNENCVLTADGTSDSSNVSVKTYSGSSKQVWTLESTTSSSTTQDTTTNSNGTISGSTSNSTTTTTTKTGTITADSLNVRSGAGTTYSTLGVLTKGKTVTIYGESNGWYKISYNSGYGWVSGKYVSTSSSTTQGSTNNSGTISGSTSNSTTSTKTVSQIKSQIATTYTQAKALSGRTNFTKQCSLYVYSQLRALNIYQTPDTYWNGSQWYSKLTANGKTRTGYTQKKYAGVNCLTNLINANGGKDVYNIVVTFPRSYRSTSTVGHVLFIHAIKDGKVYYSDNYAYNGQPEGSAIVKSVSEFTNYFSSNYSGITGAVHFVK